MGEKASVIIVNWNGERYLEQCLRSVLNQTYKGFEIILVDNNSSDGSLVLVESVFPNVIVVRNSENRGFAAGNNDGIRKASGEYIVTLNNDAIAEPSWLEELVKAVEDDDSLGMAASKMLFYDWPDVINSTGISLDRAAIAWDRLGGQPADRSETEPVEIFGPCAGAALYKRSMLQDIGLFDEDFFMYLEDVDLAWRGRLRGWRCLYVPTAEVRHVHSASSVEGSAFKNRLLGRNKIWTTIKNCPAPDFYLYLPAIIFYDLLSMPYSVLVRGNFANLQGRIDGLRMISSALRKRSEIQRRRRASSAELAAVVEPLTNPLTLLKRYRHLDRLTRHRNLQPTGNTVS